MMENKEICQKALERADIIKKEKIRKTQKVLTLSLSVVALFMVFISASFMPLFVEMIDDKVFISNLSVGTVFANSSIIGYILIGMLSFILGSIVTVICFRMKDKNERNDK